MQRKKLRSSSGRWHIPLRTLYQTVSATYKHTYYFYYAILCRKKHYFYFNGILKSFWLVISTANIMADNFVAFYHKIQRRRKTARNLWNVNQMKIPRSAAIFCCWSTRLINRRSFFVRVVLLKYPTKIKIYKWNITYKTVKYIWTSNHKAWFSPDDVSLTIHQQLRSKHYVTVFLRKT